MTSPARIYLFKVNNGNTRTICEICEKLTKRQQSNVIDGVPLSLLLTLNRFNTFFRCFVVDFEQVNGDWIFNTIRTFKLALNHSRQHKFTQQRPC